MRLGKYSIGVGDRFTHQARAQLKALMQAMEKGVEVIPVWNKSNREHTLIGSEPGSTRHAADDAVRALHWEKQYFCDADHITFETVDRFLETCDFYTIDVADSIGQLTTPVNLEAFVERHRELLRQVRFEGVEESFEITKEDLRSTAQKFLAAVMKAGEFTGRSRIARVQTTSSQKFRWMKPTARPEPH